jgi:hypothetical protein
MLSSLSIENNELLELAKMPDLLSFLLVFSTFASRAFILEETP